MLGQADVAQYQEQGYFVAKQLFSKDELNHYKEHYETMRLKELNSGNNSIISENALPALADKPDPLLTYPRLMQPHRQGDQTSLNYLLDERIREHLTSFLKLEPFAVQTMFYFKPPGARGQALHQDQYYLRVQPGTCMAAWLAVDDCDEVNGCLRVVPGSHDWPLLCMTEADSKESFSHHTVTLPEDTKSVPVVMKAGDVMFFNGQIVHGSLPNSTTDRFRRSLIAHYIVGDAQKVYQWYHPVLRMDGSSVELGSSVVGGTCGTWVDQDGQAILKEQEEIVDPMFTVNDQVKAAGKQFEAGSS